MDLPIIRYVSKNQQFPNGMTNGDCMDTYANSYYNKYLTLNAPDPDEWMAKYHSDKCIRLKTDQNAID